MERRTRYPGAQPFTDDPLSSRTYFGREEASKSLTDQILANQIVVVYAKSGLGKTSLLNAGVAPLLREEGFLPLSVRVNDPSRAPLASVIEGVCREAERQEVEYTEGRTESLWSFFKTAEFWRGDLLLTPVLILDQFEELFTLHGAHARDAFLAELSSLVRGVRPQADLPSVSLTEGAPPIRIVLSLREDHLGLLEEAADHLPQILDHRFRLAPLTIDAAAAAMTQPSLVEDEALETLPFNLEAAAVRAVLAFLSRHRRRGPGQVRGQVEPFQLQVICQRMEQIVLTRQKLTPARITITVKDIGGEAMLRETLKEFYARSLRSLPRRRTRRAVRRLCEEFLISPEGRRLSLEENEIDRQLRLTPGTLQQLVAKRLLRSDHRSDSTYYELSHDALIDPVLATRRLSALVFGWLGLLITALMAAMIAVVVIFAFVAAVMTFRTGDFSKMFGTGNAAEIISGIVVMIPMLILLLGLSRRNLRSLQRFRRREQSEFEDLDSRRGAPNILYGIVGVTTGGAILLTAILVGAAAILLMTGQGVAANGIGIGTLAWVVSALFLVVLGARTMRWGVRRLLGGPLSAHVPLTAPLPRSVRGIAVDAVLAMWGALGVLSALVVCAATLIEYGCAHGVTLPDWILSATNLGGAGCEKADTSGFAIWTMLLGLGFAVAAAIEPARLLARRATTLVSRASTRADSVGAV